jgi:ATP-dependent RNA helicase RhlE
VTNFDQLGLAETLLRAVRAEGYEVATPIQLQAIPPVLAGKDLMGCAQTGTGKTAAFALPTLHRLSTSVSPALANAAPQKKSTGEASGTRQNSNGRRRDSFPRADRRPIRTLILAPTRELAAQIGQSFKTYGQYTGLRHTVVFGGVGQYPQVKALQNGVDILVATPGRLLDLMEQGYINLKNVEILILDEADQMLDMGFIVPLSKIVASVPKKRQTLMFSATMPPEIRTLASEWLSNPTHIQVAAVAAPAELVEHSVYHVEQPHKLQMLVHYIEKSAGARTIVFTRTKHGADKVVKHLDRAGIRAAAIHGNKSQSVRQRTLEAFKSQRPPVLVATDIAARGLDVQGISHVINFELPEVAEIYVHRIGRTGRAGATGIATSFCGGHERSLLRQIERLMRLTIRVEGEKPEFKREAVRHDEPRRAEHGGRPKGGHGQGGGTRSNARPGQGGKPKSRRPKPAMAMAGAGAGAGSSTEGGDEKKAGQRRRRRNPGGHRRGL